MNKFINFEENLSEELLDENASAAIPNSSPSIDKNMTGSQLRFSYTPKECGNKGSYSEISPFGKYVPFEDSSLEVSAKAPSLAKTVNKSLLQRKSLKEDIKDLLHQAIRLRSVSYYKKEGNFEEEPPIHRSEKEITMRDIHVNPNYYGLN
ncbi:unnamed protein product [Moneuplotes crassus]|uniref:Uncharacterized protein n=1 Tax=Euplotes crassus TaxID=5936 RepID=A0AAD1U738_EUPCR|nr:unnamed protein product [Moneuplotes crassus]